MFYNTPWCTYFKSCNSVNHYIIRILRKYSLVLLKPSTNVTCNIINHAMLFRTAQRKKVIVLHVQFLCIANAPPNTDLLTQNLKHLHFKIIYTTESWSTQPINVTRLNIPANVLSFMQVLFFFIFKRNVFNCWCFFNPIYKTWTLVSIFFINKNSW